jgi:hypothetical protein
MALTYTGLMVNPRRWILGLALGAAGTAHGVGTSMELTAAASGSDHYYTNTSALTAAGAVSSSGVNGSASAAVTIGMGEIHALSQASAPGTIGNARSLVTSQAVDEITANGVAGTKVVVRWSLPVTGTGSQSGEGYSHADFGFFSQSFHDNVGVNYRLYIDSGVVAYEGYFGTSGSVDYVDVTYEVGQTYTTAISYAGDIRLDGLQGTASGTLDYANTAHAYAQVLTSGASLSAASGHDYAAPVPEPASLAALGLGGLSLLRRRKVSSTRKSS